MTALREALANLAEECKPDRCPPGHGCYKDHARPSVSNEALAALVAVAQGVDSTVSDGKPIDHRANLAKLAEALGAS